MIKKEIIAWMLFMFLFSCLSPFLPGQEGETAAAAVPPRDFGFGGMEIFQFSDLTSNLRVYDINNDHLDDILFLNNKVSRLEILIRKPNVEKTGADILPPLDRQFDNKGFVLDTWVRSFNAADMNGDQNLDIITLDDQQGVQVRFQQAGTVFGEPVPLSIKDAAKLKGFKIADLNQDGFTDIMVYREENAEIFNNDGQGKFSPQGAMDFSVYGCLGAMVFDVNEDKLPDLLFFFPREKLPLRVRLGTGKGNFGWEEALAIPDMRVVEKMDLIGGGFLQLGIVLKKGLIFRIYGFETHRGKALFSEQDVIPRRLPLRGISRKFPPAWVAADIDGDGFGDFCAAAPLLNQVHLYRGGETGLSVSPVLIDSLRNIKSMGLTGRGDLVVFSEAEKAVAVHKNKDITAFPQFLKIPGEPLSMTVGGESTVFVLYKDKDNALTMSLYNALVPGSAAFETHKPGITNAPLAVKVFPLDGEGQWGILFFMPYDKPVMYRLHKGVLTAVPQEFFRAMGSELKPQAVSVVGTGSAQVLLVTEGNVARMYRWKQDRFVVEGQLNPRAESARLTAACCFSFAEKGYLLYDEAGRDIYRFIPGDPRNISHLHIKDGMDELTGIAGLQMDKSRGILLVGQSEIQWLHEGALSLKLENLGEYLPGTEKSSIWNLFPVSLGSPGRPMAALLDAGNRSIELVAYRDGKLGSELVFEVFQDPGFNNRMTEDVYEPHDLADGDFNGDRIRDLAVLVHDKLIIYLGE